jgi:hypothetical protein
VQACCTQPAAAAAVWPAAPPACSYHCTQHHQHRAASPAGVGSHQVLTAAAPSSEPQHIWTHVHSPGPLLQCSQWMPRHVRQALRLAQQRRQQTSGSSTTLSGARLASACSTCSRQLRSVWMGRAGPPAGQQLWCSNDHRSRVAAACCRHSNAATERPCWAAAGWCGTPAATAWGMPAAADTEGAAGASHAAVTPQEQQVCP